MSIVMFEGFNRQNEWDPYLWTLSGDFVWGEGGFRGIDLCLKLLADEEGATNSNFASVTFPPTAQPAIDPSTIINIGTPVNGGNSGVITENVSVVIGFCLKAYTGSHLIRSRASDCKYFAVINGFNVEACTFEIQATEQEPLDLSKISLRVKQNGVTVATFFIPNTAVAIAEYGPTGDKYKTVNMAYLNDGNLFFELTFLQEAGLLKIRLNGMELLTSAGSYTAAVSTPSIKGFKFYSVPEADTLIDDFYVSDGELLGISARVLSPIPYAFLPRDAASGWANYDNPNAVATFDGDQTIISASTANAAAEYQYPIFNTTNQYVASVRAGVKARKDGEGSCGVQLVFKSSRGSVGPDESVNLSPIFQLKGSYDVGYTEFLPWYSEYPLMPAVEYWLMEDFTTETTHGFGVKYKSI